MEPGPAFSFSPLTTPVAFNAAYRQLFVLLETRPLCLPQLHALWAALDDYTQRHPCPTWPLALVDAQGNRRVLGTLPDLLLQLSLDTLPLN